MFAPIDRREAFFQEKRMEIKERLRQLYQMEGSGDDRGRSMSQVHS